MPTTALVKDVLWRVSVQLLDTAPQFSRFSERECVHFLNDAQVAINKFVPTAASRLDAVKLVPGSRQSIASIAAANCKPADGSTPSAPILGTQFLSPRRNMGANGTSPGAAIRVVDRDTLDVSDPLWHTRTGTTIKAVVVDPQTPLFFYVYPGVPATPDVWIEQAYNAMPVPIPNTATVDTNGVHATGVYGNAQTSTQTLTISDEHVDDAVNYVIARCAMKDSKYADPAKAMAHTQLFLGSINAKVTAMTGVNPNLRVLPGVDSATKN